MQDSIIPLFVSAHLDETKAFYGRHLGFDVTLEMPGYAELRRGDAGPRLAFMAPDDCKWKEAASGNGLIYCFTVADADAEHARLAGEGVTIIEAPEDKPWGDRAFVARDPNGISLYFGQALGTSAETMESASGVQ